MRKLLRFGSLGLAATLLISACAAPTPSTPPALPSEEPAANDVLAPSQGLDPNETLAELPAPVFPESVAPLPMAPPAPQPPVTVKGNGLFLPTGGNVNMENLYQDLPPSIPQDEAADWLGPLPGAIPEGFGGVPAPAPGFLGGGAYGAFPGVIPDLLTYNALARCLYFPYGGFYVPYYLVGGAYYPYTYSPYYDTLYSGYYAYPLFYGYGGYCYPYTFLSSNYWYGYADWEYFWPSYRTRFSHHRYRDDFDAFERRGGSRHFRGWISKRHREGGNENWRERFRSNRRGGDDHGDYRGNRGDHRGDHRGDYRGEPRGDHRGDARGPNGSGEWQGRHGQREGRGNGSEVRQGRDRDHARGQVEGRGDGRDGRNAWRGKGGDGEKVHRQGARSGQGERIARGQGRSGGKHDGSRRGGKH